MNCSTTTTKLKIEYNDGSYPIFIGMGLIQDVTVLCQHIRSKQVFIITNDTVSKLYLPTLLNTLSRFECDTLVLPDGEVHKNLETFETIIDALVEKKHHRDTTVIALGGGVIGDMVGFAAACYQRGVNIIQVPTTLLSQVDSSIGGKTAVNHSKAKNFIGAFYHPQLVVIDINTLDTLPDREFVAGYAEVVKAALIKDQDFVDWLENNHKKIFAKDKKILQAMITRACTIKQGIVERDAKEHGERALLNFGHTFGHAIEQNLGYGEWLHGEAVALGMLMAADLSYRLRMINEESWSRIKTLLTNSGFHIRLPAGLSTEKLLDTMQSDKKVCNNKLRLILLKGIGDAVISDQVETPMIVDVINAYQP